MKNTNDIPEEDFGGNTAAVAPKRSFKKSGTSGHHITVMLDGYPVYAREPSKNDVAALATADNAFTEAVQRIQRESKPGKAPQTGKATPPKLAPEDANAQSVAAIAARQDAYYSALESVLTGWKLEEDGVTIPFNAEAIRDLPFTIAHELLQGIQQSSSLGVQAASFLDAA